MLLALDELADAVAPARSGRTVADEDVHTALERGLLERLGALGGKLRAGRSRNDQVATDLRLYLRDHARAVVAGDHRPRGRADRARPSGTAASPMPGMTHLQHAQPVLLAHHLLAHVHALARDVDRLQDWDRRAAVSPLGSGALAGSSLPLDPERRRARARLRPPGGELDRRRRPTATSPPSSCSSTALLGVHLSRIGEEVILWATPEFGWVRLDDAWSTGSSIMPQKKNPDIAELARGQVRPLHRQPHRPAGHAQGAAAGLRPRPAGGQGAGLRHRRPAAHPAAGGHRAGRDPRLRRPSGSTAAAPAGFALATDVAEWLVRQGVAVPRGARDQRRVRVLLRAARPSTCRASSDDAAGRGRRAADPGGARPCCPCRGALRARSAVGGTAPDRVADQLSALTDVVARAGRLGRRLTPTAAMTAGRDRLARPALVVAPRLLGAVRGLRRRRRAGGGPADRGRGLRGRRRPGLARLPRPDGRAPR